MKIGIVIYSNDPETVWNAFRFGNLALDTGDPVKIFLLGKGVEVESLESPEFKITEQMRLFHDKGGNIFSCGTCLKIRHQDATALCAISTIKDLHEIVKESDRVLTF
jgi:uncharacterized protein involved in oxidation of intracellular sulfur